MNVIRKNMGKLMLLTGSLFLFSCSDSDNDDPTFDFSAADLTNKYWYADNYIEQNYDRDDALIVYKFNSGGDLDRQEFSGRRDSDVGTWTLVDEDNDDLFDKLQINDSSAGSEQSWVIDKGESTKTHLVLRGDGGRRDFYTSGETFVSDLDDITADAFLVRETFIEDGSFEDKFRYDFKVEGEEIAEVIAMVSTSSSDQYALTKMGDVWTYSISEDQPKRYLDAFPGAKEVKFYIRLESGKKIKLEEQIYDVQIAPIVYSSVDVDHTTGEGPLSLTVRWEAIADNVPAYDGDDVRYVVQILSDRDSEATPLYTSNSQPTTDDALQEIELHESTAGEFGLQVGEEFFVKVQAVIYEQGIDFLQGNIYEFNIQSQSQSIKSGGEW